MIYFCSDVFTINFLGPAAEWEIRKPWFFAITSNLELSRPAVLSDYNREDLVDLVWIFLMKCVDQLD